MEKLQIFGLILTISKMLKQRPRKIPNGYLGLWITRTKKALKDSPSTFGNPVVRLK